MIVNFIKNYLITTVSFIINFIMQFLDFKIPEDNWDESDSSDMDSYGSDCDDLMSGKNLG